MKSCIYNIIMVAVVIYC